MNGSDSRIARSIIAEMIGQDRQRELLRALALIGPFEAEPGETLDLVMFRERPAVHGHDQTIDGAFAFIGCHIAPQLSA